MGFYRGSAVNNSKERALLVGIRRRGQSRHDSHVSLEELHRLVDTAGACVVGSVFQELESPHPSTFIGSGKVQEIAAWIAKDGIQTIAVDEELTPVQNRNLENALGVKVLDRTAVILDIFARRARTKEGCLQVELAQLQYIQPRLKGMWQHFGQQKGGIGLRGPGETQLEVDRRRIREKITRLRDRIEQVKTHRAVNRAKLESIPLQLVSLVGYTNAGKSTLFNRLTQASVLVENKLFATLDPTVRRITLPSGREVVLADTVGFIRKLPHALVDAFKATFEEIAHAQVLIHVVDASDPEALQQVRIVEKVLGELGLSHKPTVMVLNKKDCAGERAPGLDGIGLSAVTGEGIQTLLEQLDEVLRKDFTSTQLLIPLKRGDLISQLYKMGHIEALEYRPEGIWVRCQLQTREFNRLREYRVGPRLLPTRTPPQVSDP